MGRMTNHLISTIEASRCASRNTGSGMRCQLITAHRGMHTHHTTDRATYRWSTR